MLKYILSALVSLALTAPALAQTQAANGAIEGTVTDTSGNFNVCTQRVIVVDNQPPVITCPSKVITNTSPGQCSGR